MSHESKSSGPAFGLYAGLLLLGTTALLLPDAFRDATGRGTPGTYNVRDGTFVTAADVATQSRLDPAPADAETVQMVEFDGEQHEFDGRPKGPLVLVPPALTGVAGVLVSGLALRRLRQRKSPGTA